MQMKNLPIAALLLMLMMVSCKKDVIKQDVPFEENVASSPKKTKLGSRPLLPNDPNLDVNWDWTSQNWEVFFRNANGGVGRVSTLNPFFDGGQKVYGNTNQQEADIFPRNGWMLVCRDFGTPTDANAYPFFALYNKFRGILRVGILRTVDVQSSYQQISLNFSNATSTTLPKLFKFAGNQVDFNNGNANTTFQQSAITFAGVQEWMIADFNVQGYSADISDFAAINISVSEVTQSDIQLAGKINLDGTAQPQAAGSSTLGVLKNVNSFYSTTKSTVEAALKAPVTWSSGPTAFLTSVLKLVNGFSGGGGGSTYNIKLDGTLTQNGTIKTTSPKTSFSIYLKPVDNTSAYRALQVIPWGVFNIEGIPLYDLRYYEVPDFDAGWGPDGQPNLILGYKVGGRLPQGCISNGASFQINPALANDISTIEANLINGNDSPDPTTFTADEFKPLTVFESSEKLVGAGMWHYLAVGLKITFKDGSVVYNAIPVL
jgi:hypothetical protein